MPLSQNFVNQMRGNCDNFKGTQSVHVHLIPGCAGAVINKLSNNRLNQNIICNQNTLSLVNISLALNIY